MKLLPLAFALALTATPLAMTGASSAAAHKSTHPSARAIVQRMAIALNHQDRIEVTGVAAGKRTARTAYVMRFQASDREDYRASVVAGSSKGSKKAASAVSTHFIVVGSRLYSYSELTSRWYSVQGKVSVPNAVDVLSLNSNGATCCSATGLRPGTTASYKGMTSAQGVHGYVIAFRAGSNTGGAYGTITVAKGSYLPRSYTVTASPSGAAGTFTLKYGGSFSIQPPKM